jgi:hypothetical protein
MRPISVPCAKNIYEAAGNSREKKCVPSCPAVREEEEYEGYGEEDPIPAVSAEPCHSLCKLCIQKSQLFTHYIHTRSSTPDGDDWAWDDGENPRLPPNHPRGICPIPKCWRCPNKWLGAEFTYNASRRRVSSTPTDPPH